MRTILYYLLALAFTIVCFVLFTVVFALTVAFDRERVVLHYASVGWARGIFWINPWWRTVMEGREKVERGKPYVVVVNHQSMLDIPLMYALPLCFKWVSKREVYRMPIFGWVLYMHGDIAIERGASSSAKKFLVEGKRHLDAGTSVIVFPEGTRTRDGRVGRFREGAFALARAAGVAVLPCASEGTGSVMDGWKVRMPHTFTVRVLDPIPAGEVARHTAPELAAMTRERITAAHEQLRPDLY